MKALALFFICFSCFSCFVSCGIDSSLDRSQKSLDKNVRDLNKIADELEQSRENLRRSLELLTISGSMPITSKQLIPNCFIAKSGRKYCEVQK